MSGKREIRAIIKVPGQPARYATVDNTLAEFQRLVGGYIEAVHITYDCIAIVNENGRLMNLRPSGFLDFVGTVVLVGSDGEDFADVPVTEDMFRIMFREGK